MTTPKPPVIRPGQRKPYVKATRKQIEQRIREVELLRAVGLSKTEIHTILRIKFGVEWRQTDRYMARLRVGNSRETGQSCLPNS
jgi:hypothetical protein